jgi:pimeloyl-ACP methyl ester carboxylesterase
VADKIQALYPTAQRVDVDAGHCPHDEASAEVNAAIDHFMQSLS